MRLHAGFAAAFLAVLGAPMIAAAQEPVRLYAAGSLGTAMREIGRVFKAETGLDVAGTFGPSGLLRERIEKGEPAEVFASADMGHPETLAKAGRAGPVSVFAFNRLCALVRPGVAATTETLLDRMLDPAIKLGTSTPKADPSGDYAWQLFEKAEKFKPGAYAALDAKARKLTGGPNSPAAPAGRSLYAKLVSEGAADIFLLYCTAAAEARRDVPDLTIIAVPPALAVGAAYGLSVIKSARGEAQRFADFVLSPAGQSILVRFGFGPADERPAAKP